MIANAKRANASDEDSALFALDQDAPLLMFSDNLPSHRSFSQIVACPIRTALLIL